MSRSGYTEDYDEQYQNALELYRANVDRAIRGKRGQAFLRDLLAALDAMPEKRLISDSLVAPEIGVCAIGSLGQRRGINMDSIDPDDAVTVGKAFNISQCLSREVVFENDEGYPSRIETPEHRWTRMRAWVAAQIKELP
jgi:hypothetical protein